MKITIEIEARGNYQIYKEDFAEQVRAIERAIVGQPLSHDDIVLLEVKSIIEGLQKQIPSRLKI